MNLIGKKTRPTPKTAAVAEHSASCARCATTDILEGDGERRILGETERVPCRPSKNATLDAQCKDIVELL